MTTDRGLLDLGSYQWLRARGPDAEGFLQGMVTQNIQGLKTGEAAPAWVLESSGKIIILIHIFRMAGDDFLIQTPPGRASDLHRVLDRYLIMEDLNLRAAPDWYGVSLQGPKASEARANCPPLQGESRWFEHDRCGLGGFDILFPVELVEPIVGTLASSGLIPVGMIALNRARIEAFLPWFGIDMKEGINPMVYGAADRISAKKGCYIGQETVAMTRDRGRPPMLLVWLECPEAIAPVGTIDLLVEGKTAGELTSAVFCPARGTCLAIGTVKFASAEPATNLADGAGRNWTILRNVHRV